MSSSLFTHTSTINATKKPIDLEAINLLLLGQNDPAHKINQCLPERVLVPC